MKIFVVAAILFAAPIIGVVALNPVAATKCVSDAKEWAIKTFPKPEVKAKPQRG